METTRLSSKGQIVLPRSIRASKAWRVGQSLAVVSTEEGVLLKPLSPFPASLLEEVAGSLRHRGKARTVQEMNAAVAREAKRRGK